MFGLHGPLIAHGASKLCVPLLKAVNQEGRVEGKEGKKAAKGKGLGLWGLERENFHSHRDTASQQQRHHEASPIHYW